MPALKRTREWGGLLRFKLSPRCGSDYGLKSDQGCPLAREAVGQSFHQNEGVNHEREIHREGGGLCHRRGYGRCPRWWSKETLGQLCPRTAGDMSADGFWGLLPEDSGWDWADLFLAMLNGNHLMTSLAVMRCEYIAFCCWPCPPHPRSLRKNFVLQVKFPISAVCSSGSRNMGNYLSTSSVS